VNYRELLSVPIYTPIESLTKYVVNYCIGKLVDETDILTMGLSVRNPMAILINEFDYKY